MATTIDEIGVPIFYGGLLLSVVVALSLFVLLPLLLVGAILAVPVLAVQNRRTIGRAVVLFLESPVMNAMVVIFVLFEVAFLVLAAVSSPAQSFAFRVSFLWVLLSVFLQINLTAGTVFAMISPKWGSRMEARQLLAFLESPLFDALVLGCILLELRLLFSAVTSEAQYLFVKVLGLLLLSFVLALVNLLSWKVVALNSPKWRRRLSWTKNRLRSGAV